MKRLMLDDIELPVPGDISWPVSQNVNVEPVPFSNSPDVYTTGVSDRGLEMTIRLTGSEAYGTVERLRGRVENQAYNIMVANGFFLYGNNESVIVAISEMAVDYPAGHTNLIDIELSGHLVGLPQSHQFGYYFAWKQRENNDNTLGTQEKYIPNFGSFNHTETVGDGAWPTGNDFGLTSYSLSKVQSDISSYDTTSVSRQGVFFDATPDYLHMPAWKLYDKDKSLVTTTKVFNEGLVYLSFGSAFRKNLVPNPTATIDSDNDEFPDGWSNRQWNGSNSNASFDIIDRGVKEHQISNTTGLPRSDQSFYIKAENTGTESGTVGLNASISVKSNTQYTFSAYVEFKQGASFSLKMSETGGKRIQHAQKEQAPGTYRIENTITTNESTESINLAPEIFIDDGATGEFYIYGFQLEEASGATEFDDMGWPYNYGLILDLDNDKAHWNLGRHGWEKPPLGYHFIDNWNFENWTTGDPDNWNMDTDIGTTEETTDVYQGTSALRMSADADTVVSHNGVTQSISAPASGTKEYYIEAYMKKVTGSPDPRVIIYQNGTGIILDLSSSDDTQYVKKSGTVTLEAGESYLVECRWGSGSDPVTGDEALFDAITVKEIKDDSLDYPLDYNWKDGWSFDIGTLAPLRCNINNLDEIELTTGGGVKVTVEREPFIRFFLDDIRTDFDFDMDGILQNTGDTASPNQSIFLESSEVGHNGKARFQSNWNLAWDSTNQKLTNNDGTKSNWWISMQPTSIKQTSNINFYKNPTINTYYEFI